MSQVVEPIPGPVKGAELDGSPVAAPRLARHRIELADGHIVGISVAGQGIPLVVVHGFSAEGFLYAQTLSRLVAMGFKVIAIDTAGHGGTQGLPYDGQNLNAYSELLGRVIDELGITACLLAGHSMGGRLVTQLAADRPDRVLGLVLIDAIVGDTWDRMVYLFRLSPPLLGAVGVALFVDSISVLPLFDNPRQAAKMLRLLLPTLGGHVIRPWRLAGPMISILRSRSSRYALNTIADERLPVAVLHGDRDYPVPLRTAKQAAARTDGTLVTVEDAGHSWLLRDPEALPAICKELLAGAFGDQLDDRLALLGVEQGRAGGLAEIEGACYRQGARVFSLTPHGGVTTLAGRHRSTRYRWDLDGPTSDDELAG